MWISRDLYNLILSILKLSLKGQSISEELNILDSYKSIKYNELIDTIKMHSSKNAILNQTLEELAVGNYDSIYYRSSLSDDKTSKLLDNLISTFKEIENIAEAVSIGDISRYINDKNKKSLLAVSINKMIDTFKSVTEQAKTISKGNYNLTIDVKSEKDELSIALNNMIKRLKELEEFNQKQDYIKSALNSLTTLFSQDRPLDTILDSILSLLARFTSSGKGAFYIHNDKKLKLKSTFAYTKRSHLSNIFEFGEGVVGQVALEKKAILLKNIIDDEINTATVSQKPLNTYTYPLLYEDELYGIIELASFEIFNDEKIEFLNESSSRIGAFLFASFKKEETEDANRRLKIQSEELMNINAQLEEQQQQLQQQSEELQQSNSQLEELQQQLQQQIEEMQITNEELIESRNELDKKNRDLEEANSYRSQFLANVSHELRTPLNSITLLSRVLSLNENKSFLDEDVKKLKIINESANELLKIINNILDLSKIQKESVELNYITFSTSECIEDIKNTFEYQAKEKNINLILEDEYQGNIYIDKDKFYHILKNIVANAIKFTKSGNVVVKIYIEANRLKFDIKDTGIGIEASKFNRIFEPFEQIDGSITREFGGTGLGLAIAKDFANRLNISIDVKSSVGVGSIFTLTFPENIIKNSELPIKNLNEYILSIDKSDIEQVTLLNRKYSLDTFLALSIQEIDKNIKMRLPKAILLTLDSPNSSELLKHLKSLKELNKIPMFISDSNFSISQYESFVISLISNKKIYLLTTEDSTIPNLLESNYIEFTKISNLKELNEKNLDKNNLLILDLNRPNDIDLVELEKIDIVKILISKSEVDSSSLLNNSVNSLIINSKYANERLISEINLLLKNNDFIKNEPTSLPNVTLENRSILIVDDDVTNIYVLAHVLENKGAKIIQAFNGKKALEKLKEFHIDLILMDIMMPVMDGFEAIKEIRRQKIDTPIIAVTAKALKEDREMY